MSENTKYRSVFKRLETDEEYRARCCSPYCTIVTGSALDSHVQWAHGTRSKPMQRRIVEDVTK